MIIIGLGHRARQGKDTIANYWKECLTEIELYSLAKPLKEFCRDNHNDLLWKWQLAHQTKQVPAYKDDPIYGYTAILQWYGSDVIRKASPDYWVNKLNERIGADGPEIAVITDVRFPNEADYIRKQKGYLVKVSRVNQDGSPFVDPSRPAGHASEVALDGYDWDYSISAKSGDIDELKSKARGVLANILIQDHANGGDVVKYPDDYLVW